MATFKQMTIEYSKNRISSLYERNEWGLDIVCRYKAKQLTENVALSEVRKN